MQTHELSLPAMRRSSAGAMPSMLDSFGLYATIVLGTFVVAIAFAVIGLAGPSWLGFG